MGAQPRHAPGGGSRPSLCTPSPSAWTAQKTICRQVASQEALDLDRRRVGGWKAHPECELSTRNSGNEARNRVRRPPFATIQARIAHAKIARALIDLILNDLLWRRGWDSNPITSCSFCNLQRSRCRSSHQCQRCRGALHPIAPRVPYRMNAQAEDSPGSMKKSI
jgi:hypothetical protein